MKIKNHKIPGIAGWFLARVIPENDDISLSGDFEELYAGIYSTHGKLRANAWIWGQIFRSIPGFLKNKIYWSYAMFKNYLKTALRNFNRQKGYSTINITGLTIGFTVSIMLLLWIMDELSYDGFHKNADKIFRVVQEMETDRVYITPATPAPLGAELLRDYPEVENAARVLRADLGFRYGANKENIYDERGIYSDSEFFEIFSFDVLEGDVNNLLPGPASIIISKEMAEICFGNFHVLGKTIETSGGDVLTVTGVLKNITDNSHLKFKYIASTELLRRSGRFSDRWDFSNCNTYILLRDGVDFGTVNKKCEQAVSRHLPQIPSRLIFQPLRDIYLRPFEGGGPLRNVYIFAALIFVIVIVSSINYINLATALSSKRTREVGMRKVLGASRKSLAFQFLSESFIYTVLSLITALILSGLFMPVFNGQAEKNISLSLLNDPAVLLILTGITVIVAVISGIYPALFLSSIKPVKIFKGVFKSGKSGFSFRRLLVFLQFAISIGLVICTLTILDQIRFLESKDMGFDKENLIYVDLGAESRSKIDVIKRCLVLTSSKICNILEAVSILSR